MARATVFGLDVLCDGPLSFLAASTAPATGREVTLTTAAGRRPPWPEDAPLVSDDRDPDGGEIFRIEGDDELGYRIAGPAYGESIIDAEGESVWGDPGEAGLDGWQRLLVAQVLPFVAVLRDLEVLHASGVSTASGAVALVGASGAGKTSLALALAREGVGEMLADDTLALERDGEALLAHPGAPVAAIATAEARRLRATAATAGGVALTVNEREEVSPVELATGPAALDALFFLERRGDGPDAPRFEADTDPQQLLASTFNLVLTSPARLARLLDVCARIGRLRVERVHCGPDVGPGVLARAIGERIRAAA